MLSFIPARAEAPIETIPSDIPGMIAYYAKKHSVSEKELYKTLFCESSLNPNAKNITPRERSYGVAQINLMAHKNITIEQATDPQFAIEWTAIQFAKGKQRMWTCWVKNFS